MTTLVANYVFSPLSGLWSSLDRFTQTVGYSRAAAELGRLGFHEEAKYCKTQVEQLRSK
jgi:hypothetical protein